MALFGNNTSDGLDRLPAKQAGMPPNQINLIGEGTLLEGTIDSSGDLRISGRVTGKLRVAGKVIVAQEGIVEGELRAAHADVAGRVTGEIYVNERLLLRSTALVQGEVLAARLVVEEGAVFDGKCKMEPSGEPLPEPSSPGLTNGIESIETSESAGD